MSEFVLSREILEEMDEDELRAIYKKQVQLEEAQKNSKGEIYLENSHPGQIEFHKALARVRVVFGGNRSGKSTAGTNEARWFALGDHPYRPIKHVPNKGCIVVQDFQTHAQDIILPKIFEWFPPKSIKRTEKNQAGVITKIWLKNGSVIDIKSHDQDIKVFEGSDYDWVWFDEPPPHAVFKALWRGLTDRRGVCWITGTPLTEPWLADIYAKSVAEQNKGMYWHTFMDSTLNAVNLGEGDREEGLRRIEEFLEGIDDLDERETRKTGKLLHMRGLIFKGWSRAKHVIEPFAWPAKWPILLSLDPHPRKDWGFAALGLTPSGNKILLTSGLIPGVVHEVAEDILYMKDQIELEGPGKPWILSCWIDNYASVESMIKKTTIVDELNLCIAHALPKFKPAPKNVNEKISVLKGWLSEKETKYGPRSDFLVFDNEENAKFMYEIEHYVWAKKKGADRNKLRDVPVKENDDILDSVMQLGLVLDSKRGEDSDKEPPRVVNYAGR